jgi:hypothetical protein
VTDEHGLEHREVKSKAPLLAKDARNWGTPLPFERISDTRIPLTKLEKMEWLSIFGISNDYLITGRSAAALDHGKQGVKGSKEEQ